MLRVLTWNVNGLRAVVTRCKSLSGLLSSLDAGVICFQETKLTRAELSEELAISEGYDSYFDWCTGGKTGYSGVATFCKSEWPVVAAQRGIVTADEPCFQGMSGEEVAALNGEGRCIETDHGAFVLFNVYIPALSCEERAEERMAFKLRILECLAIRMQRLRQQGRHVAIVGDLNIAPFPIDHCDPGTEHSQRRDRRWMHSLLAPPHCAGTLPSCYICGPAATTQGTQVRDDHDAALPCGGFADAFRWFHADRRHAYSCWSAATGARNNNWGSRIDHILVADPVDRLVTDGDGTSPTFWRWQAVAKGADITADFQGSDHAPVWLDVDGEALRACMPPRAAAGPLPESSQSLLQGGKQARLKTLWASAPKGTGALKAAGAASGSVGAKRKGAAVTQTSLKRFVSAAPAKRAASAAVQPVSASLTSSLATAAVAAQPLSQSLSGACTSEPGCCGASGSQPGATGLVLDSCAATTSSRQAPGGEKASHDEALGSWSQLMSKYKPVSCAGHGEPCVIRQVKKAGANQGRLFYVCHRDDGPPPKGRCNFFMWVKAGQRK